MEKTFDQEMEEWNATQVRRLAKVQRFIARIEAEPPQLVGSPVQVKWAEDIRSQHLATVRRNVQKHFFPFGSMKSAFEAHEVNRLKMMADDHDRTDAAWYIDNRRALTASI